VRCYCHEVSNLLAVPLTLLIVVIIVGVFGSMLSGSNFIW
jgi:hypothetical protein